MKPQPNATNCGFTLIEFFVVVVVLAVLLALFLPALARRPHHHPPSCVNNLKQVGLAFRQWALDNGDKYPMQVSVTNGGTMELSGGGNVFVHFLVMSNELNTPKVLFCPQESNRKRLLASTFSTIPSGIQYQYTIPFTNDHSVSYFVGLDAVDTMPQMFLAGDCNFQISGKPVSSGMINLVTNTLVGWTNRRHKGPEGNIALADGSVQKFTSTRLREALANTGDMTNRLAIP